MTYEDFMSAHDDDIWYATERPMINWSDLDESHKEYFADYFVHEDSVSSVEIVVDTVYLNITKNPKKEAKRLMKDFWGNYEEEFSGCSIAGMLFYLMIAAFLGETAVRKRIRSLLDEERSPSDDGVQSITWTGHKQVYVVLKREGWDAVIRRVIDDDLLMAKLKTICKIMKEMR